MQIKYYINIKDNTLRFKVSIFKMGKKTVDSRQTESWH